MWNVWSGPILFMSNDDIAWVALGPAATKLQPQILLHLDYCVKLLDHNFTIAECHIQVPPVYHNWDVKSKCKVNNFGKSFARIRNGKLNSFTAFTHAYDLREIFSWQKAHIDHGNWWFLKPSTWFFQHSGQLYIHTAVDLLKTIARITSVWYQCNRSVWIQPDWKENSFPFLMM